MGRTAQRVVVVGASLGGLRAAEQLRRAGFAGEIVVIGEEPHMPYNRPPLSKTALASEPDFGKLAFAPGPDAADAVWRLGRTVVTADLPGHTVTLADGSGLTWDGLVVASGLRPRRLVLPGPAGGRHVVRTLEDARALRTALAAGRRVVVVGAGFVGCEVAATATGLGADVTVVAPEPVPMLRPLGEELGTALLRRHESQGVRFVLGRMPTALHGDDTLTAVELSDGSVLAADVLVEAVGCAPRTEWLTGNGLDLSDGALCDNRLRVGPYEDVVAVGDVARFPNPRYDDTPRRVEHWSIPGDTAVRAADTLAAALDGRAPDAAPFAPLPTFWSDQFDIRLKSFGAPDLGSQDVRVLEGDPEGAAVVGYHRDGELVGVVSTGSPRMVMPYRRRLLEPAADDAPVATAG
ncbi:ferredoxin reductase [Streptomyces sp. MNU77]|uniref:NAD(P)/FAD-dependent oxidoreductase n=1 Tax=Streptomyces sp. MNU77 TaxID=1573406 RepID=UPI00063FE03A|nr:FAD-dependent oxidoreductase [Streptomyces sp. MNU77]OLO25818.1 ferredoxin reductase [Streptomyces sp. MNU77]